MKRIHGNLQFSQSLNEYFATDDMLEPALLLIAEAIRNGPDLANFLRGGSVAAAAMRYRHRASPRDHDWNSSKKKGFYKNSGSSDSTTGFEKKKGSFRYKVGYCFQFQHTGSCETTDCAYMHKCSKCQESTHGEDTCQRN